MPQSNISSLFICIVDGEVKEDNLGIFKELVEREYMCDICMLKGHLKH
jgi:hypothetical protein